MFTEVVNVSSVMDQLGLGPNGGLLYAMEYLESHAEEIIQLIQDRISSLLVDDKSNKGQPQPYLILDLPGQVELYTHSTCVQQILHRLAKALNLRLTAVQLVDAQYCTDANKFLSAALLGTATMIRLELPTVNVLSKVDLLAQLGELPFSLEYFTQCQDLHRLVPFLDQSTFSGDNHQNSDDDDDAIRNPNDTNDDEQWEIMEDPDYQKARQKTRSTQFFKKRAKLHLALSEVVEDFGLLGFMPLDITHAESVGRVLARIDKANGYVFTADAQRTSKAEDMFQCAVQAEDTIHESVADIQERIYQQRAALQRQQQQQQQPPASYVHRK